jgi:hypothetical protein
MADRKPIINQRLSSLIEKYSSMPMKNAGGRRRHTMRRRQRRNRRSLRN